MIRLREIADQDLARLADYLVTQPRFSLTTKETWERRFSIWWSSNPAFTPQYPRGWILEDETSPRGFIGSVPVPFVMGGEVKTAVAAVGWYVDPLVRGLSSIGLLNEFAKQKDVSLYLFNTDKEDLMNLLSRLRFRTYVLPRFQQKYFFVFRPGEMVHILIRLNVLKRVHTIPSFLEMMKQITLFTAGYLKQKPLPRPGPDNYKITLCTSCDDSFPGLWQSSSEGCDVYLSRDKKTLDWLYFSSIEPSERLVIQCRAASDDSLAGYMVFDLQRSRPSESPFMKLMDLCIREKDPEVLTALLQAAIETGRKNKAAALEVWAPDTETEAFLQHHFSTSIPFRHHNLYRFPDSLRDVEDTLTICPSLIAPPRGIDH